MKKSVKKLMSAFMAVSCMASAMAMNVSAIDNADDRPVLPVDVQKYLADNGYVEFDDSKLIPKTTGHYGCFSNGEDIITLNYSKPIIYFDIDCNHKELTKIWDYTGNLDFSFGLWWYDDYFPEYDGELRTRCELTVKSGYSVNLREFLEELNEVTNIYSFRYTNERYEAHGVNYVMSNDVTDYHYLNKSQIETFQQYIEKNSEAFTDYDVVTGMENDGTDAQYISLIPKDGVTLEQRFETAKKIQLDLGGVDCDPSFGVLGMMTNSSYRFSNVYEDSWSYDLGEVDVSNSIDGDANEDGDMNIADAAAIVQAIGNPDKYALTSQGEFNADVDGDGLTGLDALAIQIKLANPEK